MLADDFKPTVYVCCGDPTVQVELLERLLDLCGVVFELEPDVCNVLVCNSGNLHAVRPAGEVPFLLKSIDDAVSKVVDRCC